VLSAATGATVVLPLVTSHATSWHDGGVAVMLPTGQVVALAGERVGDRYKHSWNSRLAYEHLRQRLPAGVFGGEGDLFVDSADGLEPDGHHLYHAASTYFASGFPAAAVLVVDGQGPAGNHLSTTTVWDAHLGELDLVDDLNQGAPPFAASSLGHFYTAVTALAGFRGLFREGSAMALAAYGRPSAFLDLFHEFVSSCADGTYTVDPLLTRSILGHTLGPQLYGWPPPTADCVAVWDRLACARRAPVEASWPTGDDMDIAFAGQQIREEVMLGLARRARDHTGRRRLCIAGGAGLNCVANEKVRRTGLFEDVFVPPAPGDDGQALGRLYVAARAHRVQCPPLTTSYLGPVYPDQEVRRALDEHRGDFSDALHLDDEELVRKCAAVLSRGALVGWFQGGSEWGPRALGHRSVLADPRSEESRERLNRMKGREWFRPVAPVVTAEAAADFFDTARPSPFMAFAVPVRPAAVRVIPAAVHVDGTARLQTVTAEQNPLLHRLLVAFGGLSGVPILINTSFNGHDEPIVETPRDALASFLHLRLDYLALGNHLVRRYGLI
jgi:carbamoyltransferase